MKTKSFAVNKRCFYGIKGFKYFVANVVIIKITLKSKFDSVNQKNAKKITIFFVYKSSFPVLQKEKAAWNSLV